MVPDFILSAIGSTKHRGCFNRAIEPSGADVYAWAYPLELNKLRRLYKALRLYLSLYRYMLSYICLIELIYSNI